MLKLHINPGCLHAAFTVKLPDTTMLTRSFTVTSHCSPREATLMDTNRSSMSSHTLHIDSTMRCRTMFSSIVQNGWTSSLHAPQKKRHRFQVHHVINVSRQSDQSHCIGSPMLRVSSTASVLIHQKAHLQNICLQCKCEGRLPKNGPWQKAILSCHGTYHGMIDRRQQRPHHTQHPLAERLIHLSRRRTY